MFKIRTAGDRSAILAGAALLATVAFGGVIAATTSAVPAGASVQSVQRGCSYAVHVESNPNDGTRTYVTGTCDGHAPYAYEVARDLRVYQAPREGALPMWLHWGGTSDRVHGGPCAVFWAGQGDTSAELCPGRDFRGYAYTS